MPVINRIADFTDEMTGWRRDIHQHPEIGLLETRTSARIQSLLKDFGVDEVVAGIAQTGVVGVIRSGKSDRGIGLRADIDALPILEATGAPHASLTPGVMHACGHDGHTAMLLGAAKYLAETRRFDGTVYVIFQPAEENAGGGAMMVREGLFDRFPMQQVYGLHNWPSIPQGTFVWAEGPVMAAVANIDITLTGHGAHGAQPHRGIDPILIAGHIITALQSIVARNLSPTDAGVVTIGSIDGGAAFNVIPETVTMKGTARWFKPSVGDQLENGVRSLVTGIAGSFGARATVEFRRSYPATVNDGEAIELARDAAIAVVGESQVQPMEAPSMGGEDFSFMLNAKQGAYIMMGTDDGSGRALHHPRYDFNDAMLPVGASYWATLAERLLPKRD